MSEKSATIARNFVVRTLVSMVQQPQGKTVSKKAGGDV